MVTVKAAALADQTPGREVPCESKHMEKLLPEGNPQTVAVTSISETQPGPKESGRLVDTTGTAAGLRGLFCEEGRVRESSPSPGISKEPGQLQGIGCVFSSSCPSPPGTTVLCSKPKVAPPALVLSVKSPHQRNPFERQSEMRMGRTRDCNKQVTILDPMKTKGSRGRLPQRPEAGECVGTECTRGVANPNLCPTPGPLLRPTYPIGPKWALSEHSVPPLPRKDAVDGEKYGGADSERSASEKLQVRPISGSAWVPPPFPQPPPPRTDLKSDFSKKGTNNTAPANTSGPWGVDPST